MEEEEEQVDNTLVTFGSIIAISDFVDQNAFLFSDGFLKQNVSLKSFKKITQENSVKFDGLRNDSFFKCLFQVLPRVSDTIKTRAIKTIQEETEKENRKQYNLQQFQVNIEEEENKWNNTKLQEELSTLMNEYKQNVDAIEKSKWQKLTYHQPFQLLHIASGKFLACHDTEAFYENQNYQIKLDDYSSDYTVFKIVPAYNYQSHGEQDVNAGEMCSIIRSAYISNRLAYINCSQQEIAEMKGKQVESKEFIYKKEVNANVEQSHLWKIVLYQQYLSETSRNLRVGDCIWLYHSEAESTLSVTKLTSAVDKETFAFCHLSEWLAIRNLNVSITEAQSENSKDSQGSINSLWQIEAADLYTGGSIKYEQGYRLKNLSTGYYLGVKEVINQNKFHKKQENEYCLLKQQENNTVFQFIDLKTQPNQKYLKGGCYTYIQNLQTKNWMDFQYDRNKYQYIPILKPENNKTEHAIFKIQMATRNQVWEIQFLLSCFRKLAKFLISIQDNQFPLIKDVITQTNWIKLFKSTQQCIYDLDNFVCNKAYTTSAEQIYGQTNFYRQKMMKEQFYIDILIKILERIITKSELEKLQKSNLLESQKQEQEQNFELEKNLKDFIQSKINLCNQIYKFLSSVCKQNNENQHYTFELIPYFQLHAKYLPISVNTIIDIISNNKQILYKLSETLKIGFENDDEQQQFIQNDQVKILINLYQDEDEEEQIQIKQHEKIIKKPVPLIQYFLNLIWDDQAINNSYYLQFLSSICSYEDQSIQINQENIYKLYVYNNKKNPKLGVETKAEKTKSIDNTVRLTQKAGHLIIPSECDENDQNSTNTFLYIQEQLKFFSEVAQGRNFFWKKELGAQFEKSFLFRNIWNQKPIDAKYLKLQPGFAKLALTLYIDQDPLKIRNVPILCQLFDECQKPKDFKVFKSSINDGSSNIQELETYNDLLNNLTEYLLQQREKIKDILFPNRTGIDQQKNILNNELILNTTRILDKIMKLNLIWDKKVIMMRMKKMMIIQIKKKKNKEKLQKMIQNLDHNFLLNKQFNMQLIYLYIINFKYKQQKKIKKINKKKIKKKQKKNKKKKKQRKIIKNDLESRPQFFIKSMIQCALDIFIYDRFQIPLIKAHYDTEQKRFQQLKDEKKIQIRGVGKWLQNIIKIPKSQNEDINEQNQNNLIVNEQHIYLNPIMKGYLKLSTKFIEYNYLDPKQMENEVKLKIKLCDFFEYLLDLRQDFMIQNTVIFFKNHFLKQYNELKQIENIKQLQLILKDVNKQLPSSNRRTFEQLNEKDKDLLIIQYILKINANGLLPNLALTGITQIDNEQKKNALLSSFNKIIKLNQNQIEIKKKFYNYINDDQIPEILDLDKYLSLALGDEDQDDKPMAALFPYLLLTFSHIQDSELEKRCLQLIMRLFTQKKEYKKNLQQMQLIFDEEKKILYQFLTQHLEKFQNLISRVDDWINAFILGKTNDFDKVQQYLQSFLNGMKKNIKLQTIDNQNEIQLQQNESKYFINAQEILIAENDIIDQEKQQLYYNLNAHQSIINLIRNGLIHLHEFILDDEIEKDKKLRLIEMLQLSFQVLKSFCYQFKKNQIILFEYINYFNYLQYDVGQLELIETIFCNNKILLSLNQGQQFINQIIELIIKEGRQCRFLNLLKQLIINETNYIFDNQILVQNILFPQELKDNEIKILYCDGSKSTNLQFYFDDLLLDPNKSFFEKLEDLDFRDTFRDEPFHYHKSLIDLILQTSLIDQSKRQFQADIGEDQVKQNFNISVGKLKQTFKAYTLLEILKEEDGYWLKSQPTNKMKGLQIVKTQIYEFLRLIHISSEKGQIQHSQLYTCQQQIIELFEFEIKRIERKTEKHIINDEILQLYYEGIFPFCISYYDRFLKTIEKQDLRKDLQIMEKFFKMWCNKICFIQQDNQLKHCITTSEQAKIIYKILQTISKNYFQQLQSSKSEIDKQIIFILQEMTQIFNKKEQTIFTNTKNLEIEINTQNQNKNEHEQQYSEFHIDKDEKHGLLEDQNNQDMTNLLWEQFKKELIGGDNFQKVAEKERETIANAILNVSNLIDPETEASKQLEIKPDIQNIATKLISYLQKAFSDPNCKASILTLLQVFKKMITTDNNRKQEMQNLFDKLGATQMVLLVLSDNKSDNKLIMAFLKFINVLLEGGNEQVQNTIYNFMMNFTQSQNIFQKIYFIIKKQIENLETGKKQQKKQDLSQTIDTQQQFTQIKSEETEDLHLVLQVLTFLQNGVEGHYKKLQNYFREQINSKNNYDLISVVIDLFKTYYYDGSIQKNYDNMLKCLDTLNELVQGPCQENQKSISESKFLDIAADLFQQQHLLQPYSQNNQFEEDQFNNEEQEQDNQQFQNTDRSQNEQKIESFTLKKNEENFPLKRWQLFRLINKILNLVMSLLEGSEINAHNPILKRIMRNLPINLLEKHVVNEYNKYFSIYREKYKIEALEHMIIDPNEIDKLSNARSQNAKRIKRICETNPYFETILQNGFLLFFLISYYIESDQNQQSQLVQIIKEEKKKLLKQTKGESFFEYFKTSYIYTLIQLVEFSIKFIKLIFGTLDDVKNIAQDQLINQNNKIHPNDDEDLQKIKEKKYREDLQKSIEFYLQNSAHIDVMHEENLVVVYFIKLPLTKYLPKEQKLSFHDKIDRSTTQAKVQGLINISSTYIEICKHEEFLAKLFQKYQFGALFTDYVSLWRNLAFLMTIFFNLFILFSFDGTVGDRVQYYIFFSQYQTFNFQQTQAIVYIVGIVMTCLSLFVVSFYLLKNGPLIIRRALLKKGLFSGEDLKNPIIQIIDIFYKFIQLLLSLLEEFELFYYLGYGIFALLGTFYHPLFFVFHLTEILFQYPTLKNIVLSVYKPINQLALTFCLLFLLVYIFTIFEYWLLSNQFNGYCDTLLYCFLMNIEWTFRGSIGDYVQQTMGVNDVAREISVNRFFYDEVSNITLGVIMLNIVAGIIIDTFTSLREDEDSKLTDMGDNCFICGNKKAEFDRLSSKIEGGFKEHITLNHYMWNYIFFTAYLDWKEKTDYSGIESYVAKKLEEEDESWVPFNRARELVNQESDDLTKEKELIEKIENKVHYIQEQVLDMGKQLKVQFDKQYK